ICRLAAADPGVAPCQADPPLLRHPAPRHPPGARAGQRTGPVLQGPGPGPGGAVQFAQPQGGAPRAGRAPGGCAGTAARELPRGADPASPRRPDLPGMCPAHGPDPGQRGKTLDARPGAAAPPAGGPLMSHTEGGNADPPEGPLAAPGQVERGPDDL